MKLVFFNVPTSGHVNPSLPLAAELVRRGHGVVYYLTEAYREKVEATGAEFRAYSGMGEEYFDEVSRRFNPVLLATQLVESSEALLSGLVEALRAEEPDGVIYDAMCPWGRLAADVAGVPAIASMSLLDLPMSLLLKSGELLTAVGLMVRSIPGLGRYRRAAKRVSEMTQRPVAGFPEIINWPGDLTINYSTERFLKGGAPDDSFVFIGPPVQERPDDGAFSFEQLDSSRPLIYISLGTVFNDSPDFYRQCLAAFVGDRYQVVMSSGRRVNLSELGPIPANFVVRAHVPQLKILQRAALFVTHAGVNSVNEGLYYDVPLLMVPQQLEQALVAARVAEMGAGLVVRPQQVTVERLRALAGQLLDEPGFRVGAAEIGASLRAAGGVERGVEAIEGFLAGQ